MTDELRLVLMFIAAMACGTLTAAAVHQVTIYLDERRQDYWARISRKR